MSIHKSYKDSINTYEVHSIKMDEIEEHCARYMDSITGVVFHGSEISALKEQQKLAILKGMALSIYINNVEVGYLYAIPVGKLRYNVIVLHCYEYDAVVEAILAHELYLSGMIMRYTPKDPKVPLYNTLLQPLSLRIYRNNKTEFIKMIPNLDAQAMLTKLNIEVV